MKFILAYRLQNDLEEVLSFLDKLHFTWNTGRRLIKYIPKPDKPYPRQINIYFDITEWGLKRYCTRSSLDCPKYPLIENYYIIEQIINEITKLQIDDLNDFIIAVQKIIRKYV